MAKPWTKSELSALKALRKSGKPVKTFLSQFPGRSQYGIEYQMRKLRKKVGPKKRAAVSLVWTMAYSLLGRKPGMTAFEIALKTGFSYRRSTQVLLDNHQSADKCIFISGWERRGANQIPLWSIGNEPDAPKLASQTHEEERQKARVRYQRNLIKRGAYNPFATICGSVLDAGARGRVFTQSMSMKDEELEAA